MFRPEPEAAAPLVDAYERLPVAVAEADTPTTSAKIRMAQVKEELVA